MEKRRAEVQNYLKERVNPILEPLILAIIKSRPENIISFAVEWLTERGTLFFNLGDQFKTTAQEDVDSEEENDVVDDIEFNKKKKIVANRNRSAVSAEAYGEFNKKTAFVPKMIEKSEDTNTRLLILMSNSFLFKSLDQKDADIVKGAMEERYFKAGDYVIK